TSGIPKPRYNSSISETASSFISNKTVETSEET
ncbi:unnamed protein product, partial [marine sediment metagenome]